MNKTLLPLILLLVTLSATAFAQLAGTDIRPGDSCTAAQEGHVARNASADRDISEITLICDGSQWQSATGGGSDTLAKLACSDGQVAAWNESVSEWACANMAAGGGGSDGGGGASMVENWPDALNCKNGSLSIMFLLGFEDNGAGTAFYNSSYGAYYLTFNAATQAYTGHSGLSTAYDCVAGSWSIADFKANGRAFNFVGGGGSDVAMPPVCSGASSALQWDGSSWICQTIAGGGGGGSSNSFAQAADLPVARARTASARLGDGRVLICGGVGASPAYSNRCDIYNPANNTFTQAANLPQSKMTYSGMAPLADGRVLVCGGQTGSGAYTNRCDIYDGSTDTFTQVANLPQSKGYTAAAPLADGRVLICGGYTTGAVNRCDIYNPANNTFTQVANLPQSKYVMGVASLNDGRVLFCGGWTSAYVSRCDIYNPGTNAFTQVASLPQSKGYMGVAKLDDGRVLFCGGYTGSMQNRCDTYNADTNTFAQVTNLPLARYGLSASTLTDGRVLFCGGHLASGHSNRCDIYTP